MSPRITKIEIYAARMPLVNPLHVAIGSSFAAQSLLIRVHTDARLIGLGEGSITPFITGDYLSMDVAGARELAPLWIDKDPLDIESRMKELNARLSHNPVIKCAFDMALYDLAGKCAGLPLYALLGGAKRGLQTDMTAGLDSPEAMAETAGKIQARGFRAIKVKLGTNPKEDVRRIDAIRARVGAETTLRVDANQGWNESSALAALNALGGYNIQYCESPVPAWNIPALTRLRAASPIPIIADEALFNSRDAFVLASAGACDLFNIKLAKSGGIFEALKINAVAESAGIACMVGCMIESRIGLSATAHLASARGNILYCDLDSALYYQDDPVTGGMHYEGDVIVLPDTPGHGAEVDPAFLKTCETVIVE